MCSLTPQPARGLPKWIPGTAIIAVWSALLLLAFQGIGAHYGILLGIADYPGTANDLSYSDDDAMALYEALIGDGVLWSDDRLALLLDDSASKDKFLQALTDFASAAGPDDTLVIYFSGHGTRGPDVEPLDEADGYDEYLCTYGETVDDYVRDDELSEWLSQVPFGKIVVIMDACFSGGEIRVTDRRVKSIWTGNGIPGDGFLKDLRATPLHPRDLDDLSSKEIVALAAAGDNQYSWEIGPPFDHGLFTYYLLEALGGWAEGLRSPDGYISAQEAFAYLEPRVSDISEAQNLNQSPQLFDASHAELPILASGASCRLVSPSEGLFQEGWYMLAFPGIPCGSGDPEFQLGDDIYPVILFHFDPEMGGYRMYPADPLTLRPGEGYWVRLYEPPVSPDIEARIPDHPAAVTLAPGWNQIGNPFPFDIPLAQLEVRRLGEIVPLAEAQARGWVSAFLFGYDANQRGYVMLDPESDGIRAWRGYWMRAYVKCELMIPAEPAPQFPQGISMPDNPELTPGEPPPPPAGYGPRRWEVRAIPNPVRDVDTTVFMAEPEVEELLVEVYDLSGRLMWKGESRGSRLLWHTEGLDGYPLANGVYVYLVYVKINGQRVFVKKGKLVILH